MSSEAFELPAMVAEAPATLLQALPARPPTPPRGSDSQAAQNNFLKRIFSPKPQQTTPVKTAVPTSSAESYSSEKARKKVEWSAWTDYKDPPKPLSRENPPPRFTPLSKSSSALQKTPKSILKPYNGVIPVDNSSGNTKTLLPHTYSNFATMLESITKQLAGEDRSSRLDAYSTLNSVLKACDNVPDPRTLKDKMGLLMQFIQRDMVAKLPTGMHDNTLINASLVLLATFLHKKAISDTLSLEFSAAIMDHAIGAFEGSQYPKDVTKHLMFIMAQQNFPAKVMTTDRVGRLLASLHNIEDHVKGKSIISGRIQIYQKFLKQSRNSFLVKTSWIRDLFTDMLSSFKDIRSLAISFGSEVSLSLGTERQASRAMLELFDSKREDGVSYGQYYSQRLSGMVRGKQDGEHVPQIWIIVILFLRCTSQQLEQWAFIKPWLVILQDCFNSTESGIKLQAYHAWNKFVSAILLEPNTSASMIKMLAAPLTGQLKRKIGGRHTLQIRQSAMSSICNLLYYAFRPGSTFTQLDQYWDEYVVPIVGKLLVAREGVQDSGLRAEDLSEAIAILTRLLDSTNPKIWKANLAFESTAITPDFLPSIDPRWVRKNHRRVLSVLAPIIEDSFLEPFGTVSSPAALWKAYISTVAAAGAKEIKVSPETMSTIAYIFEILHRIWRNQSAGMKNPTNENASAFGHKYSLLVSTLISGLGTLPFTEKLLAVNSQISFTVITTPSHRPTNGVGDVRSPLDHLLLALMKSWVEGTKIVELTLTPVFKSILTPFLEIRDSRKARLEFLKDMNDLLSGIGQDSLRFEFQSCLFELLNHTWSFKNESSSSGSSDLQPLGIEYRNAVEMLIKADRILFKTAWRNFYTMLISDATATCGDGGCALGVIEPLLKAFKRTTIDNQVYMCYLCTRDAKYPHNAQALEASRRRLWGVGGQRESQDPYSLLYSCQNASLESMYNDEFPRYETSGIEPEFMSFLLQMLKRRPVSNISGFLCVIQNGLALWLCDSKRVMLTAKGKDATYRKVLEIWKYLCGLLENCISNTSLILLSTLISSAFESTHKSIVTVTIKMWNRAFSQESHLDYTDDLVKALQRIRHVSDIVLPSFPKTHENELPPKFTLLDSQDFSDQFKSTPRKSSASRRSRRSTPKTDAQSPAPPRSAREITPKSGKRKTNSRTNTPRLRHDDSQIQFAAIDSSPLSDAADYSQVLTDHQREVKERQATEAAAYPELHPVSTSRHKSKKGTGLRDVEYADTGEIETSTAPRALQPAFEDVAQSSPTPHRNEATSLIDSDAIDPPSSPPEVESASGNIGSQWKSSAPSTDYGDDIWNSTLPPTTVKPHGTPVLQAQRFGSSPELGNLPSTPTRTRAGSRNHTPKSPAEVFVDAVSSPAALSPGKAGSRWESEKARNKIIGRPDKNPQLANDSAETNASQFPKQTSKDRGRRLSSPLSDLDEASVIRIMGEFDNAESDDGSLALPEPVKAVEEAAPTVESEEPASAAELQKKKRRGRPPNKKNVVSVPETPVAEAVESVRRSSRRLRSSVEATSNVETPIVDTKKRKMDDRNDEVPDSQDRALASKGKKPRTTHQPPSSIPIELILDEEVKQEQPVHTAAPSLHTSSAIAWTAQETPEASASPDIEITVDYQEDRDVEMEHSSGSPSDAAKKSDPTTQSPNTSRPSDSGQYPQPTTEHLTTSNEVPETSSALQPPSGAEIVKDFETLLKRLQSAKVTRTEAMRIENALWDFKGALYEAEKRGRNA